MLLTFLNTLATIISVISLLIVTYGVLVGFIAFLRNEIKRFNGTYTINISFISSGEVKAAAESEFSLICKAEQNPNVGFAQHALALGIGTAENSAYFSKLFGCGIIRDDYPMCFVENYDGSVRTAPDNSTRRITGFNDTMH